MVKGVTKRVVEIKETGSQYFDRAIFFVNMDGRRNASEYTLSQEARNIIDRFSKGKDMADSKFQKKDYVISILKYVGSAAFGSFLTLLFTQIL